MFVGLCMCGGGLQAVLTCNSIEVDIKKLPRKRVYFQPRQGIWIELVRLSRIAMFVGPLLYSSFYIFFCVNRITFDKLLWIIWSANSLWAFSFH